MLPLLHDAVPCKKWRRQQFFRRTLMAFLSGLTPDDYNKKPGDLIKSSDWGMLVSDVIGLGKAKLDRDGDTLHGTLSVAGALTIDGTGHVGNLRITPGSASSGLWLGDVGESNWGVYRRVAGTLQSPRGGTAVAGNQFNGQALCIRTAAVVTRATVPTQTPTADPSGAGPPMRTAWSAWRTCGASASASE
jgi:hypothetical protein